MFSSLCFPGDHAEVVPPPRAAVRDPGPGKLWKNPTVQGGKPHVPSEEMQSFVYPRFVEKSIGFLALGPFVLQFTKGHVVQVLHGARSLQLPTKTVKSWDPHPCREVCQVDRMSFATQNCLWCTWEEWHV
jgi:hypothetical protein